MTSRRTMAVWMGAVVALLAGCKDMQARACLDEVKLRFNDPDSVKLVQVLGARGWTEEESGGVYWVRYKATNKFGGVVSANIACSSKAGTDRAMVDIQEHIAFQRVYGTLLDAQIEARKRGQEKGVASADQEDLKGKARSIVYEETGDLPKIPPSEVAKPAACRGSGGGC